MNAFRSLRAPLLAVLLVAACADPTSPAPVGLSSPAHAGAHDVDAHGADAPDAAAAATPELASGLADTLCADVSGGARVRGARVIAWGCHGRANQQFALQPSGAVTVYDGALCLDVSGGGAENGTPVIVWTCHGRTNQRWQRTAAGELRTAVNGKCLDVTGTRAGAPLQVYSCDGRRDQRWTFRTRAAAPVPVPAPVPPPTPPAPDSAGTWTRCAARGAYCDGVALHDVRMGPSGGPYVVREVYGAVVCEVGVVGPDPAPGRALVCDAGPTKTTTLGNPMPGMGGLGTVVRVALGAPGASGPQLSATSWQPPSGGDHGSFRTTCGLAKFAFDDPIVYPGRPGASHLHVFFGNTAVTGNTTPETLAAAGNSTCRGGTLNRSSYWAPALVDVRTGAVLTPTAGTFYYKTGYSVDPASVRPIPAGLRMIAGDKNATGSQEYVYWGCRDVHVRSASVPTTCSPGDAVRLTIQFPQCWDGRNLDSPDHKSHMAYPTYRNPPARSTCPATHPVVLPEITEFFDYPVTSTAALAHWRLSSDMYATSLPGGYSAHADWMNGWDVATMRTLVTQCLNRGRDCGVGNLGNGMDLF